MSQKNEGICKLCQEKKILHNSHILPAFAFRRMLKGKKQQKHGKLTGYAPSAQYNKKINIPTNGVREHLLCEACEKKLGKWEKHVADWLDKKNEEYPEVDYKKFKLFQLSIIWRLSISDKFGEVSIANNDKEVLRGLLLKEDAGSRHHYPCMLRKFTDGTVSNTVIGCDGSKNIGGILVYSVHMVGYIWEFFIANQFILMKNIAVINSGSENPFLSLGGHLPIHVSRLSAQRYINEITKEPLMQAAILQNRKRSKP